VVEEKHRAMAAFTSIHEAFSFDESEKHPHYQVILLRSAYRPPPFTECFRIGCQPLTLISAPRENGRIDDAVKSTKDFGVPSYRTLGNTSSCD